ncbi:MULTISPECIES: condensation domain-containing protein, partial [unclassified Bradyrhizobium]|uniref:condensation domain-containing protein n=1 Tax=unclassified Bradyrhizobium TaxID=2631580 RepID=UPI002915F7A0
MLAEDLVTRLDILGVELHVEDGLLKIRAPKGTLTSELRNQILVNRDLLIRRIAQRDGVGRGPAFVEIERPAELPLSYAQERLWLLEQIGGLGSAYNLPAVVRLRGQLDVAALERSLAAIIERHESLRTRFAVVEGRPVQVIDPPGRFALQVEDLSELGGTEQASRLRARVGALARGRFELERGPLFRAHLLRLSGEEHVAVVVMHHIVSDGWSMGVLTREVGALYAAFVEDKPSPLPKLAVQYADYGLWQRGWLQGEALDRQVAYWKERLSGAPAALELPTDRPRPAVQSYHGASYSFTLPTGLTASLHELARREGATLFMVLLGAYQLLLSRYSGQDDIVVGSPIAGRTHRELEGLIGFFVNTLALRTDLGGQPSFRELLGRVRETALGAYAHQDVPFEKLVVELNPVRDLSRQPLFQVLFALQNMPAETLELPGLALRRGDGEQATAKFDLSLYVHEREGRLEGRFEYATDLFEAATIERLSGHFGTLLEGIVAAPDARIGELALLSEAERE